MTKGAHGGFAEYAICPAVSTFAMPDAIPLPDAAALYFPFHLAWLGLFDRAELQPGETVLIHAAAGGSGSAAIQLAVHAGARVFATAGRAREGRAVPRARRRRRDQLHDATTSPRSCSTRPGNRGVDVVFDNVGEAVMDAVDEVHRLQRSLPDDGLRVRQGRGRREVHRAAADRARELQAVRRAARVRDPATAGW